MRGEFRKRGGDVSALGTWAIRGDKVVGWNEKSGRLDVMGGYEEFAASRPPAERAVASRLNSLSTTAHYPKTWGGFMQMSYLRNEVVRGAFKLILNALTQARHELVDAAGNPVKGQAKERFDELMMRPGGMDSDLTGSDLREQTYLDALSTGNWAFEKVPGLGTGGEPVRLWRMDLARTAVMPASEAEQAANPDRRISAYLYQIAGQWYPIPPERVVHWRNWDGCQDFFGLPDLYAAMRSLAADVDLIDLMKITLQNMGVVPHVIEYPLGEIMKGIQEGTMSFKPNQDLLDQVADLWEERTTGKGRGKPWVSWGWQVKAIGLDFSKLAIGDLVATTERRVAMALNVPILLLNMQGVEGGDQGKNFGEAKRAFYQGPIAAQLRRFEDTLSAKLAPHFVKGGRIVLRTDHIATLREARAQALVDLAPAFQAGGISRHTLHRLAGETPHGPDVFMEPAGRIAIPATATSEAMIEDEILGAPSASI